MNKLTYTNLLDLVEKELDYYRKGIRHVFITAIASQALVLTGQKVITVEPTYVGKIITICFFACLVGIVFIFYKRYGDRIRFLRTKRTEMIEKFELHDPTNDLSVYTKSIYHVYLFIISAISIIGIFLVFFEK